MSILVYRGFAEKRLEKGWDGVRAGAGRGTAAGRRQRLSIERSILVLNAGCARTRSYIHLYADKGYAE